MKALITAAFHEKGLQLLWPHMEVQYESFKDTGKMYNQAEELAGKIKEVGADVLIVEADVIQEELFEACDLKIVACCRRNPLNVSREAATSRGIPIFYAPGRNADAVADLTLGFMLSLARSIDIVNLRIRKGALPIDSPEDVLMVNDRFGGFELGGATIGLVGLGSVGRKVLERLKGFGAAVLVHDPYVTDDDLKAEGVEPTNLETLLERSDIVSLHASLTDETRQMIGADELALMKPTAFLINTAQSLFTDKEALLEALKERRIAGAAIDVFDEEPLQQSCPFLAFDNVICTPHLGGATRDVIRHQSEMIANDIIRFLNNERPKHIWNPEVLRK